MRTLIKILFHPIKYIKFQRLGRKLYKEMSLNDINEHSILYDYFYKDR